MPEVSSEEGPSVERQQVDDDTEPAGRWRCQIDVSWTEKGEGTGFGFILFEWESAVVVPEKNQAIKLPPTSGGGGSGVCNGGATWSGFKACEL